MKSFLTTLKIEIYNVIESLSSGQDTLIILANKNLIFMILNNLRSNDPSKTKKKFLYIPVKIHVLVLSNFLFFHQYCIINKISNIY